MGCGTFSTTTAHYLLNLNTFRIRVLLSPAFILPDLTTSEIISRHHRSLFFDLRIQLSIRLATSHAFASSLQLLIPALPHRLTSAVFICTQRAPSHSLCLSILRIFRGHAPRVSRECILSERRFPLGMIIIPYFQKIAIAFSVFFMFLKR